jgi:hypothetical protein
MSFYDVVISGLYHCWYKNNPEGGRIMKGELIESIIMIEIYGDNGHT